MSGKSKMDNINVKRIKLEHDCEKLTSFGATCRNSVVDYFKLKCMKFIKKQLDDKSVLACNTFNLAGKIIYTVFCNLFYLFNILFFLSI